MTALPPDLQEIIDAIDAADRAGDALASELSDTQFHWQPDGGRAWSIAQCLEHLAVVNRVYSDAIHPGVERARGRGWQRRGPISSTIFGRRFIASMEPPVTRRFRSPRKVRPGSTRGREEILRIYREAHQQIRALAIDAAGIDVNRATFSNPFLPLIRMRVGTGLRVIAAHDRRHLWQAEQVRHARDFPAVTPARESQPAP